MTASLRSNEGGSDLAGVSPKNQLRQAKPKVMNQAKPRLDCAICQEEFDEETPVIQMPCHIKHIFHGHCIRDWLNRQNSCPLCKQKLEVPADEMPDREELRLELK